MIKIIIFLSFLVGLCFVIRWINSDTPLTLDSGPIMSPTEVATAKENEQEEITRREKERQEKYDKEHRENGIRRINFRLKYHDFNQEPELVIDLFDKWSQGTEDFNVVRTGYDIYSDAVREYLIVEIRRAGWAAKEIPFKGVNGEDLRQVIVTSLHTSTEEK